MQLFKIKYIMKQTIEKLKRQLYNWGFYILAIIGGVLDFGFDAVKPELVELGLNPKWIIAVRIIMFVGTILKAKLSLPTQNIEKLKDIVQEKDLCENEKYN